VPLDEGVAAVSASNASGARAAVQHLLSLGHRRIAALTGIPGWLASSERFNGYHSAHAAAGVLADPVLVVEADYSTEGGEAAAAKLLDLPDPPTAVFAFNDNMAVAVLREARRRGLRVPEDLSVVGFDDSQQAGIVTPELTSVRQPLAEMGRMAVSLLLRLLENQRVEGLNVELQTRLVVRDSTAPPRG
jgi:LacI family transcriptional regulator